MITTILKRVATPVLLLLFIKTSGQELRTFNQNSSRSNNAKSASAGFDFQLTPQYAINMKNGSPDSLFFRGNGSGMKMNAGYSFGNIGIGLSSGFLSSQTDKTKINSFISRSGMPLDQMVINTGNQQNMYALIGPYAEFGKKIKAMISLQGGLFVNNSGYINIQRKGAVNSVYRNEPSSKSIFPGLSAGINLHYAVSEQVSLGFNTDYLNTKSEVVNYDIRRGGAIEGLKLSKNISTILAGISVRYTIRSSREASSGMATGRKRPGRTQYGNITNETENISSRGPRQTTSMDRTSNTAQSCGAVTVKRTNTDGSTEEISFACPEDAASYNSRISTNMTVPKQTQGATFGEKTMNALHKEGIIHRDLAARNIISGKLTWGSPEAAQAIVTNTTVRGSSVNMNTQNSSTRTTPQSSFGTMVRLSAREAGSGMATGRRYEPIFAEGQGDVCNPCLAATKMSGVQSNPLYNDKGLSGENPLYESNKRTAGGADEDCDGIAAADIILADAATGTVIAKTKTERCGDFFFANVPEGDYVIKVSASFSGKKGYDIYLKSKSDLRGGVTMADDWNAQLLINTGGDEGEMSQKAGISTSRSNIRTKSLTIIEADLDGDGEYESVKVLVSFDDGTTKDVTAMSRMSNAASVKKITVRGWDPEKKQAVTGSADGIKEYTISMDNKGVLLTSQYENGKKEETNVTAKVSHHPNVIQYTIPLNDDGPYTNARIGKSRSNIQNNRMVNEQESDDSVMTNGKVKITKSRSNIQNNRMINTEEEDEIWSPRSNIKMLKVATGDVDGDGRADLMVGGLVPGGAVISSAMRRPGEPIPGIDIKLGKNPGSQSLQTTSSNASGEFEFTKLEAGDYTITTGQKIFIEDETPVTLGGSSTRAQDHNSSRSNKTASIANNDTDNEDGVDNSARKGWDGTVKGGNKTKAQDYNSSRSNKTASIANNDTDNEDEADNSARKGWDGTIKGGNKTKAQDYNSSRSNKTSGIVADDPDNGDAANKKTTAMPVKWTVPETLQKTVNTSRGNIKHLLASLDDLEDQLDNDASAERSIVNTSRSNIKTQRLAIYDLQETLASLQYMDKETAMNEVKRKTAAMSARFLALQESVTALGTSYNSISNVLKTKHDTVKNSINNVR